MDDKAPFDFDAAPIVHSIDWINEEMAKKQLPPLKKASELKPIEFISTGIPELDAALAPKGKKVGGFPKGRVVEIYGPAGSGKTTVTLMCTAALQKQGKKVLFIDAENAFNNDRAEELGVDTKALDMSDETILEEVIEIVRGYLDKYDVIVLDSLAATSIRDEYDEDHAADPGGSFMGVKPRIVGQLMRQVVKPLADSGCTFIIINQERASLQPFGKKTFVPGGNARDYAASLRIELKSGRQADLIKKSVKGETKVVGQWVEAKVVKTKVGNPYAATKFKITY